MYIETYTIRDASHLRRCSRNMERVRGWVIETSSGFWFIYEKMTKSEALQRFREKYPALAGTLVKAKTPAR